MRPPIEVPSANVCFGRPIFSLIAVRAANWSALAEASAHNDGPEYDDPTRAYPSPSRSVWVTGSGESAGFSVPKPWLYRMRVPFHFAGTSAIQLPPSLKVPV